MELDNGAKLEGGKTKEQRLGEKLKAKGIHTLVVGGVVAETCVDGTIRDAYERDYHVIVPVNSVGSNRPNQLAARMEYWNDGFVGNVVTEAFIKDCWPVSTE